MSADRIPANQPETNNILQFPQPQAIERVPVRPRISRITSGVWRFAQSHRDGIAFGTTMLVAAGLMVDCGGDSKAAPSTTDIPRNTVAADTSPTVTPTQRIIIVEITPTATATRDLSTPTPPRIDNKVLESAPESIKRFYSELLRINKANVLRDASTGKPLSQEDIDRDYTKGLQDCVSATHTNLQIQTEIRFAGCVGPFSNLYAQFLATGRNPEIARTAQILAGYVQTTWPELYNSRIQLIPQEFRPEVK